jgi:hypothetical protein
MVEPGYSWDDCYIDPGDAVDREHALNAGVLGWWMALPGMAAGGRLLDLMGVNHGTLTSGPTWGSFRSFPRLAFTGGGSVSTASVLSAIGTSNFTASAVVRTSTAATACLFGNRAALGRATGWTTWVNGGAWYLTVDSASGKSEGTASGTFNNGQWRHIAVSVTRNVSAAFYIDGQPSGTLSMTTSGTATIDSGAVMRIGQFIDGSFQYSDLIGDVRLDARAFTSSDVSTLYQQYQQGYPDLIRRQPTSRSFVGVSPPAVTYFLPAFAA